MEEHKERFEEGSGIIIVGRNAVLEALRSGKQLDAVYLQMETGAGSKQKDSFHTISAKAKALRIPVKHVSAAKLSEMSGGENHQGVAAAFPVADYCTIPDLLQAAADKNEQPFLILCDGIEDPHNLGAIIRTAEAAGAHGVIIPKHRSAGLTQTVYKTSAGAASVLPVCRVTNLAQAIDQLKKEQVWVYCADMDGTPWYGVDYSGGAAIIVGSEGKGVSRLVREKADVVVSLPMNGQINSLNASVAAGIVMYEVARQRLSVKAK